MVPKLRKYHEEGYKIVIFTNQAGVEKKRVNLKEIQSKIVSLVASANIPIQAFIACATNHYRKPHSTMFDYFLASCNSSVKPALEECFYVGDAAGRTKGWKKDAKRDFGCSDRKFARNVGMRFMTPEECFQGLKTPAPFEWRAPEPDKWLVETPDTSQAVPGFSGSGVTSEKQELVVFVGFPASGKSSFAQTHLVPKGYHWVNRDTLGTAAKCIKVTEKALLLQSFF